MPPEQPPGLTGEAVEHWDLLVGELSRLDLLKPIDGGALAMACESWSKWRQAESVIQEEGVIGENSQGRVVHPAVRVSFDASREYRAWVAEFGLSPSAEGKLGGGNKERESGSNPFARSTSGA